MWGEGDDSSIQGAGSQRSEVKAVGRRGGGGRGRGRPGDTAVGGKGGAIEAAGASACGWRE